MSIETTLKQRGNRYGSFSDNAKVTQGLMKVIETAPSYVLLHDEHKEAIHMVFHKVSRIVCGDPLYADNVHDIAGYAKLLEDYLDQLELSDANN